MNSPYGLYSLLRSLASKGRKKGEQAGRQADRQAGRQAGRRSQDDLEPRYKVVLEVFLYRPPLVCQYSARPLSPPHSRAYSRRPLSRIPRAAIFPHRPEPSPDPLAYPVSHAVVCLHAGNIMIGSGLSAVRPRRCVLALPSPSPRSLVRPLASCGWPSPLFFCIDKNRDNVRKLMHGNSASCTKCKNIRCRWGG